MTNTLYEWPKTERARKQRLRLACYVIATKKDLDAIAEVLRAALNSGANQTVRQALQELAQHHTDLENHIEGSR